jgi:DNA-binding NtrC family response regulator
MSVQAQILLVDDDPAALSGLAALLREEGYLIRRAASFQEAKDLLTTEPHQLLITDVRLGSFNGLQLVAYARLHNPGLPVIVATGYDDPVIGEDARRLGALYISKPIVPVDFLDLVAKTLASATPRSATPGRD